MKKTILIFLLFLTVNAYSQKLSRAFDYIQDKNYDKALNIFSKSIGKGKNVFLCKYGEAIIYTRSDYTKPNKIKAYKNLVTIRPYLRNISESTQYTYSAEYGLSTETLDTLINWILDTEYQRALETPDDYFVDYYLETFANTKQAARLEAYRDSARFADVVKDGSIYALDRFISDYPQSKLIPQAVEKRDSVWKVAYDEAYKGLEISSIVNFEKKYPNCPFYDDSTAIYRDWAKSAHLLELPFGYISAQKVFYGNYIKKTAPSEMAFQVLLILMQKDLEKNDKKSALDTVEKYKVYFHNNKRIRELEAILKKPSTQVTASSLSELNTIGDEYMPVITADEKTIYFCGKYRPNNLSNTEDIFVANKINEQWQKAEPVKSLFNSYGNESPLSISADGNTLVIFENGNIFITEKKRDGWTKPQHIKEINSSNWEADAVISADGNAILFASDRRGNIGSYHPHDMAFHGDYIGNLDIYVCQKTETGWTKPQNLGTTINTPYAERTPFLHHDLKTLYFASDGHTGIGKLDIFKSTRLYDTSWLYWSEPVNLGSEINTPGKDFGYKISTDGKKAYFANFLGTGADIFVTTLPEEDQPEQVAVVSGTVLTTQGQVVQADIIWEDLETGEILGNLKSSPIDGKYFLTLPLGKNYGFFVSNDKYYPISDNIDLRNVKNKRNFKKDFIFVEIEQIIQGKVPIKLNNVFFDFNKYNLKKESYPELNRLAMFIKKYPNIKFEISGHTDDKGTAEYNKKLSSDRANEVKKHLVSLGCASKQMEVVGYGSEKPVADNNTEEGRKQNRRVEFRVIP